MNDLISVNRLESDQEQFANSIIQSRGAELPATIEEIIPVLAFSKAKMEAFKALSDAAQKVSEQQELNEAALASGQRWGIVHLYGQKRLGEITEKMPKASAYSNYPVSERPAAGKEISLNRIGITRHDYHEAEQIAKNPEILDRVIEKAKETGDIPTKTGVLREIKKFNFSKMSKEIDRTAKPDPQKDVNEVLFNIAESIGGMRTKIKSMDGFQEHLNKDFSERIVLACKEIIAVLESVK